MPTNYNKSDLITSGDGPDDEYAYIPPGSNQIVIVNPKTGTQTPVGNSGQTQQPIQVSTSQAQTTPQTSTSSQQGNRVRRSNSQSQTERLQEYEGDLSNFWTKATQQVTNFFGWLSNTSSIYNDLRGSAQDNPVGQEVALIIATTGGIPQGMTAEQFVQQRVARANAEWSEEDYNAALAVAQAALENNTPSPTQPINQVSGYYDENGQYISLNYDSQGNLLGTGNIRINGVELQRSQSGRAIFMIDGQQYMMLSLGNISSENVPLVVNSLNSRASGYEWPLWYKDEMEAVGFVTETIDAFGFMPFNADGTVGGDLTNLVSNAIHLSPLSHLPLMDQVYRNGMGEITNMLLGGQPSTPESFIVNTSYSQAISLITQPSYTINPSIEETLFGASSLFPVRSANSGFRIITNPGTQMVMQEIRPIAPPLGTQLSSIGTAVRNNVSAYALGNGLTYITDGFVIQPLMDTFQPEANYQGSFLAGQSNFRTRMQGYTDWRFDTATPYIDVFPEAPYIGMAGGTTPRDQLQITAPNIREIQNYIHEQDQTGGIENMSGTLITNENGSLQLVLATQSSSQLENSASSIQIFDVDRQTALDLAWIFENPGE